MDRYKFRAKDIDQNKWRYGSLVSCIEYGDNGLSEQNFKHTQTKLHYIIDEMNQQWIVYPKSISQFTGMKDYHSIDIYEGDIMEYSDSSGSGIGYVDWCGDEMSYLIIDSTDGLELMLGRYYNREVTIIGNMYDRLNNNEDV